MTKKLKKPFNRLKLPELDGPAFLTFGTTNAKLYEQDTATFSVPAGYTCPGASKCLAWADRETGKLQDGEHTDHRCYAASLEAIYPALRKSVDRNLALLKQAGGKKEMASLISMSLPGRRFHNIRVHVSGDFFSQDYFDAWVDVARINHDRLFYGYTKSLPMWINRRADLPKNMVLTASWGGKWDAMIKPHRLRSAIVVHHPHEAVLLGLRVDHDDGCARLNDGQDFALLLHGVQPAGSKAAESIKLLRKEKVNFSYSKKPTTTNEHRRNSRYTPPVNN